MSHETIPPEASADRTRSVAVVLAAALQIAAGAVGGAGLWGEPVGTVANSYPTPLLPAGGAFTIWSLIYVTFAALAFRQVLPAQRVRPAHRRTGWWLTAAGVLNAGWVVLFSQRQMVLAQIVIVGLLVCLGVAAVRLIRTPATDWFDRLLLHTPIAIYTGWVAIATVAGAATTIAALGTAPSTWGAVIAIALTTVAIAIAALRLPAVAGFAAAVCWALAWIVAGTSAGAVQVAGITAAAIVLTTVVLRLYRATDPATTAWG